jgi:hypothetical protein
MSWLYSQALVAASLGENSLAGEPYAPSNGTPTPQAFLCSDKTTAAWTRFPSGMTCKPLTADHGEALLMSYRAGFPVRTYQLQAVEPASRGSVADCGGKWRESLAKWDRATSSWKTHQLSLLEGLESFSGTWPRWGMMRNGECWELSTRAPRTAASASGLWATPTANQQQAASLPAALNEAKRLHPRGQWSLITQVAAEHCHGHRMWPTPTCQDAENNGGQTQHRRNTKPLNAAVGGALNPVWVEWLMGWSLGWTDLKPLATDRFQQWSASHGISSARPLPTDS